PPPSSSPFPYTTLFRSVLTAEEPPRAVRLAGEDLRFVLHTYGTVGIVTRLRLPLEVAHTWQGWYATFASFDAAYEFGWDVSDDPSISKRLVSVHQAPIRSMVEPVERLFTAEDAAALLVLDRAIIARG